MMVIRLTVVCHPSQVVSALLASLIPQINPLPSKADTKFDTDTTTVTGTGTGTARTWHSQLQVCGLAAHFSLSPPVQPIRCRISFKVDFLGGASVRVDGWIRYIQAQGTAHPKCHH
ncbi:hypothetical protein V8C44DRAFT_345051 [Trichoderma aethiopicum]